MEYFCLSDEHLTFARINVKIDFEVGSIYWVRKSKCRLYTGLVRLPLALAGAFWFSSYDAWLNHLKWVLLGWVGQVLPVHFSIGSPAVIVLLHSASPFEMV
jgi:hypothetical protein